MDEAAVSGEDNDDSRVIHLNVGGKLFCTTSGTLRSSGPDSLLSSLSLSSSSSPSSPIFIDRDPSLFSSLLSLLRRSPSSPLPILSPLLSDEASGYFSVDLPSLLPPLPPLLGFDSSLSSTLLLPSHPSATSLDFSSRHLLLLVAHGQSSPLLSTFDYLSLSRLSTFPTHLDSPITSLRQLAAPAPTVAALASRFSPALHFYHLPSSGHLAALHWSDPSDLRLHSSHVTALAPHSDASAPLFAAFEARHRENAILAIDPVTLQISSEIGRSSGAATKSSAPTRLAHLPELGLLFASAVSFGAFGYAGYVKLWDPRTSGRPLWEANEPGGSGRMGDPFADVDVDADQMEIYKVCSRSGDVAAADLRMLGDNPWVYLTGGMRASSPGGKVGMLHCYKKQIFVGQADGLEVWTQLEDEAAIGSEPRKVSDRTYRRNYVDAKEDAKRGTVCLMQGGGERLFVCRDRAEGVEVWESSDLAHATSAPVS